YQAAQVALAQSQLNVTKAELIKNVSLAYALMQFGLQQVRLLDSLETMYASFSKYAGAKYAVGETNLLEKLSAESQLKTVLLEKEEAEANLLIYQSNLQHWVGTTEPVSVLPVQDFTLPAPQASDTSLLKANPRFKLQQDQLRASIASY